MFNSVFFIAIVAGWSNYAELAAYLSNNTTMIHVCVFFYIGSFLYVNRMHIPVSPYYLLIALFLAAITLNTDRFSYSYILVLVTFFCTVSFLKQFAWMDRFGDYSYGVYLYGWPAQQALHALLPSLGAVALLWPSLAVTFAIAALSWFLVEKPALDLKRRLLQGSLPQPQTP